MTDIKVVRWILDVDPIWPAPVSAPDSADRPRTKDWESGEAVKASLDRLSPVERTKVLKYCFTKDAKLSLGSCLLKRRAVVELCQVPWSEVDIVEGPNRKPCYKPRDENGKTLEFNVSHHGSLVALVACTGTSTNLGVDVVSVDTERQEAMIEKNGFENWARTYESVFSDREMQDIIDFEPPEVSDRRGKVIAKIRHFFAHWCLKEAQVKMTSEALLASWLKSVDCRHIKTPSSASQLGLADDWGETVSEVEFWSHDKMVPGVKLEVTAFRDDYMVAVAASDRSISLPPYQVLDLDTDVLP